MPLSRFACTKNLRQKAYFLFFHTVSEKYLKLVPSANTIIKTEKKAFNQFELLLVKMLIFFDTVNYGLTAEKT